MFCFPFTSSILVSLRLIIVHSGVIPAYSGPFLIIPVDSGPFRYILVSFRFIPVSFWSIPVLFRSIPPHSGSFRSFRSISVFSNARSAVQVVKIGSYLQRVACLSTVHLLSSFTLPSDSSWSTYSTDYNYSKVFLSVHCLCLTKEQNNLLLCSLIHCRKVKKVES